MTIPHIFIRCRLVGTDHTLDYVRCDKQCKLVVSFPNLGWVDASALGVNQMAAPALAIQFPTCIACFSTDWDGAPMAPLMASVELVSVFTLVRMGAGADALESLGILSKVYTTTEAFLGALEVALPRLCRGCRLRRPSCSPVGSSKCRPRSCRAALLRSPPFLQ